MIELLVSGGAFLLLDQWSKFAVRSPALRTGISLGRAMQIRYVTHCKFFYQRADAQIIMIVVWFAALASAVLLHYSSPWFHNPVAMAGLGCALGGAAGNLADILRCHCVVDFIDFGWWPVFNLADVGIVGGLVLAFLF